MSGCRYPFNLLRGERFFHSVLCKFVGGQGKHLVNYQSVALDDDDDDDDDAAAADDDDDDEEEKEE